MIQPSYQWFSSFRDERIIWMSCQFYFWAELCEILQRVVPSTWKPFFPRHHVLQRNIEEQSSTSYIDIYICIYIPIHMIPDVYQGHCAPLQVKLHICWYSISKLINSHDLVQTCSSTTRYSQPWIVDGIPWRMKRLWFGCRQCAGTWQLRYDLQELFAPRSQETLDLQNLEPKNRVRETRSGRLGH